MLGVLRSEAPRQPRSWQPRSSRRMTIKFGFERPAWGVARPPASAAAELVLRKSLRVSIGNPEYMAHSSYSAFPAWRTLQRTARRPELLGLPGLGPVPW